MQTVWTNNSRIRTIKNAKFSGYYFFIFLNIERDFQICISVPLILEAKSGDNPRRNGDFTLQIHKQSIGF